MSKQLTSLLRATFTIFILFAGNLVTISPAHAGLYSFTSYTFTPCAATGKTGPTLAQCQTTYGTSWSSNSSYYTVTSGIQYWTAPATGSYQITAAGAVGAGANKTAGRGAIIRGTVTLTQGSIYKILVGQPGTNGNAAGVSVSGGGGGGTYFADNSNTPIIVAGGGGGLYTSYLTTPSNSDGQTTTSGTGSTDSYGAAGTNGGGGGGATSGYGGGGGGMTANGTAGNSCTGSQGLGFINGGTGGTSCSPTFLAHGGFGGGGGTHGNTGGGGGGGGYSGGGGSGQNTTGVGAGGGGSYIISSATNKATSNGLYAGSSTGITNLAAYNGTYQSATLNAGYLTIELLPDPVSAQVGAVSGPNTATYRSAISIQATLSVAGGKVTFYAQGKKIPGCINIYTATTTATCSWRPSQRGTVVITAKVIPDNGSGNATSPPTSFLVGNRSSTR